MGGKRKAVQEAPTFKVINKVDAFCNLARDQQNRLWFMCSAPKCVFGISAEFKLDPIAAVKVHFKISHLPIDYRR